MEEFKKSQKKAKTVKNEKQINSKLEKYRVKRQKQRERRKLKKKYKKIENKDAKQVADDGKTAKKEKVKQDVSTKNQSETDEEWRSIFVCKEVIMAIQELKFKKPTEIQARFELS